MDFFPLRRVRNERQYSSLSIYRDDCYISDSIIEIEMLTITIAFYQRPQTFGLTYCQ